MVAHSTSTIALPSDAQAFYARALRVLVAAGVPFMIGGAYAFQQYTGIVPHSKDFDVFLRKEHLRRALAALADAGCETEVPFTHWLAKAHWGPFFVDLIFSSGNGVARVDDEWFRHACPAEVFGESVRLVPAEEMLWQKAMVMERERYDGADVAHLLRARADRLDWGRLLRRFDGHWRVLLSHLTLFGYVYPGERGRVPAAVMDRLLVALQRESATPPPATRLCRGTNISREQYLTDIDDWGYEDARRAPHGGMTDNEIAEWTDAIANGK